MSRVRVLCVDDEPLVLEGLTLHLRRRYSVHTATGGAEGLELARQDPTLGVIVSDMRMPGMDGAAFLREARAIAPDATRILLTGHADMESAKRAVNDGYIFRFLTKPCPPATLLEAVEQAAEHHRLVSAERVLLEETLHGSIATLVDVLALGSPAAFGRATRVKQTVGGLARDLRVEPIWQVEVAAMLSQLGFVTLPAETVEKVHDGRTLTDAEAAMVARVPEVTERLLAHIPRLEAVRAILAWWAGSAPAVDAFSLEERAAVERGAHLLRLAADFDTLQAEGYAPAMAVDVLRGRGDLYEPAAVAALAARHHTGQPRARVRELPVAALEVGMVLAEDVRLTSGTLLAARGYEVTLGFVERARNYAQGMVREPVRVILKAADPR